MSTYDVSAIRDSEKIQLSQIGKRPWAFQRAISGARTLALSPPKGGSDTDFSVFRNIIQLQSNTLCENFSGEVVEQLISYEITEEHRTKSVSFHLKYWLLIAISATTFCLCLGLHALCTSSSWLRVARKYQNR